MLSKPLHICIVTGQFPALTETFITNKVLELHKRGHRITVITNQSTGHLNESHRLLVVEAGIEIIRFTDNTSLRGIVRAFFKSPELFFGALCFDFAKFKKKIIYGLQRKVLSKYPYDIVHFEFSGLGIFFLKAFEVIKGKVVVSCRGTAEKVIPVTNPERVEHLIQLFKKVDAIHCVSEDMAKTIAPFNQEGKHIFINRPSIDIQVFSRKKPYTDNNTLQLLSVGRLMYQKGYMIGLLTAKKLKEGGIPFTWTIVGDGPQRDELVYNIHAMSLTGQVILAGKKNRDEIINLYENACIFFIPSIYEGIANVCLEAMAMQLPVVSSDCSGMPEVITHGENGMLAPNYDYEALADCIVSISKDFNLRQRMGSHARKTIEDNFTLKRQVNEFEKQYQFIREAIQ